MMWLNHISIDHVWNRNVTVDLVHLYHEYGRGSNSKSLSEKLPATLPSNTRWSADKVKFILLTIAGCSIPDE